MSESNISICLLYPDLLGTYGDGGNARVLSQRLTWRGISNEVVNVNMGDDVPETCDIYVLGGGEDQPQTAVTEMLSESRVLHRAHDRGAVIFAVCAGMQILGERFAVEGGKSHAGLGLLDIVSERGEPPRCVGEIVVQPDKRFGELPLTGYENHGGKTILGPEATPLGRVISGRGNDDGSGTEGACSGAVVATYLHGPALARNYTLADVLLEMAIGQTLARLDDTEIDDLRSQRLRAAQMDRIRPRG